MLLATLPLPPLAAVVTTFVLVMAPVLVLMLVWTCVTMARILFPERQLPIDPSARRERARRRGLARDVGLRDLIEDQRHAEAPAMPQPATTTSEPASSPTSSPLADDLWLRRN